MEWISVEERLPEVDTLVLVTHVDEMGPTDPELSYRDVYAETDTEYWTYGDDVTHWCPIPELPLHHSKEKGSL